MSDQAIDAKLRLTEIIRGTPMALMQVSDLMWIKEAILLSGWGIITH